MILDGDILSYFDSISVDVKYEEGEDSSFTFLISYREFDLDCILRLDHENSSLSFNIKLEHPKAYDQMAPALNALNMNTSFKAYFNRIKDVVVIEATSFVTEENLVKVIDYYLHSLIEEDYGYIENLYNSIYSDDYQSIDEDSLDEMDDDTTIEEDLAELMSLLNNV